MNRVALYFSLSAVLVVLAAIEAEGQMRSYITVQGEELNNSLQVLNIERDGTLYQLTCKQEAPSCSSLNNGRYQMVELPKNFGAYECKDVEIYAEFADDPQKDKRLGEYCMQRPLSPAH